MMRPARPPRPGRQRALPRQPRRAGAHPAGHHRHRGRRPAAVQRGRDALDHLQRRDLQLRRARARSCAAAATSSAPPATPRSSSTRGRSGARTASPGSTASGRSRCGTAREQRLVLSRDRLGVRPLFYIARPARPGVRLRGQGAVRRPGRRRAPSTRPGSTRRSPTGRRSPRARCSAGVAAARARARTRSSTATGFREPPLLGVDVPRARARAAAGHRRERRRRCGSALVEATAAALPAQRRAGGRVPVRRLDSSITAARRSPGYTRGAAAHLLAALRRTPSSTRAPTSRRWRPRSAPQHQEIVVRAADIAEVFPEVVRHAETPILRAAPAPLFLLSRLVRESGFKVVVTGEGADEVLGRLRPLPRGPRARSSGRATRAPAMRRRAARAALPVDGALPGQAPGLRRAASSAGTSTPTTRRSPTARGGTRPPRVKALLVRGACARSVDGAPAPTTWSTAMPPGQRGLGPAGRGPVAGDDDAAARLHPRVPGRPDAHGQLRRGPVPVPRPRRRRARGRPARPAQAVRARGEVPAQARVRRPRAGGDPAPPEAALPGAGRRQLLRRRAARVVRRGHLRPRPSRRRACSTRRWWPGCSRSAARTGGDGHEQHRQHAAFWRSSPPSCSTSGSSPTTARHADRSCPPAAVGRSTWSATTGGAQHDRHHPILRRATACAIDAEDEVARIIGAS